MSRGRSNPRRKGTGKKKNQAQGLSNTTLAIAVILVVALIGGLYFIVQDKKTQDTPPVAHQPKETNSLPPKPTERWTYIKELENLPSGLPPLLDQPEEPAQQSNKPMELTPEQRQLLEQMQTDMRQAPTKLAEMPSNSSDSVPRSQVIVNPPVQKPATEYAPEQQSRYQLQSPQTPVQAPQSAQPQAPNETKSNEANKPKAEPNESRLLLQCGSFHTMEQAESVRASLAFAGIESRIVTRDNWNKIVLGPYKGKESAEKMHQRVKNTGIAACILRPAGG